MNAPQDYPWLKNYPDFVSWDDTFEPFPVQEILDRAAAKWPDSNHLDFFGRKFSYSQTQDMANRLAKSLQDMGVGKGVNVGIFLPNCPQYVLFYFAILKAGGTVVNFSPLYSEGELKTQIEDSQIKYMVTMDLEILYPKMRKLLDQTALDGLIMCDMAEVMPSLKGWLYKIFKASNRAKVDWDERHFRFFDMLGNSPDYTPVPVDVHEDIAVLQYTGGTTGLPKGAELTHAVLTINCQQGISWRIELTPGKGATLGILPFFHIYALALCMDFCTMQGGEIIIMPRFDPKETIKAIRNNQLEILPCVPTVMTALLNEQSRRPDDLMGITTCISGGAPLPVELEAEFGKILNDIPIRQGYGLTESGPLAVATPPGGCGREGSVGLPMPDTVITFCDTEDPHKMLPYGETGEICIEGPQIMKGYWRRPEATDEVIIDGRLRSGDIGYMDDDGYLYILDRSKDMILVGGMNVYPRVIEEALYEHDAVREVTVIGVPDEYSGEKPKAFIVLADGYQGTSEAELTDYLRGVIGKHEIPREIEFRDQLPKTPVGKLSKKELVAEEKARFEAQR